MRENLTLRPDSLNWHDGVLVEIGLRSASAGQRLELTIELYDEARGVDRTRFHVVSSGLIRVAFIGDCVRLVQHARAGNIRWCSLSEEDGVEHLSIQLFGGALEASAMAFTMKAAPP